MNRSKRGLALLVSFFLLAACATNSGNDEGHVDVVGAFLEENGLADRPTREIVDHLDRLGGEQRPTEFMASVRAKEVIFITDNAEYQMTLADDEFYVSIAPFRNNTHACTYHSLTTCQGELTDEEFDVEVVTESGDVILEEPFTTFENGFIGMWLPRDITGQITITDSNGQTGTVPFTTDETGATCITTLQLAA